MTDSNQWEAPGGSVPPVTPPPAPPTSPPFAPPTGAPAGGIAPPPTAAPQYGAPQYGAPQYGQQYPGPQAGWTPPPKPGLIPLRPMTLGTILGASFQVMRRNPRPTFGVSLLINGIVGVLSLALVGILLAGSFDRLLNAAAEDVPDITAGTVSMNTLASGIELVLGLIAAAVLQGIISLEVARGTLGEKLNFPGLWRLARGRVGVLIGWSLLLFVIALIALVVLVFVSVAIAVAGGSSTSIAVGVLLGIGGLLGLAVVAVWIGTRVSLVPSILVLERLPLRAAVIRSWTLTTGYFWRTFGIQALVSVMVSVASQIVLTPVALIGGIVVYLSNPNGDPTASDSSFFVLLVITTVFSTLIGAVTSIITSATSALLYIDLRMRKEGLDLDLARFVEARQSGVGTQPDPYLAHVDRAAAGMQSPTAGGPTGVPDQGATPPSDSPWV
ncbi:hypothetical protein [Glaciihabitans sp. dw_435]|uniref:hypothetical protein n=1 Tax=Glaciihabitans sp. dw_435 TaxID=2720081 RepID=UPI001BD20BC0|nr:hypothetical protein [Glaciihabitans sp. dw_435]